MGVTKCATTLWDHTHVAVKKAMLWMKMEEPAQYHVVGDSQNPVGLSIAPFGLSDTPLKISAVNG